jgi:hypothetical protein
VPIRLPQSPSDGEPVPPAVRASPQDPRPCPPVRLLALDACALLGPRGRARRRARTSAAQVGAVWIACDDDHLAATEARSVRAAYGRAHCVAKGREALCRSSLLTFFSAYSVGEEDIIVMSCRWMPDSREGTARDECIEGYRTP